MTLKIRTAPLAIAALCLTLTSLAAAQEAPAADSVESAGPINTVCPIGNEPIVESAGTIEYKGVTLGFCCPGCDAEFLAWPEARRDAFVQMAEAQQSLQPGALVPGTVRQIGAMRETLRQGATQARIQLAAVTARPHAFAVGALAGLAGEITIVDGQVWIARAPEGAPIIAGPEPGAEDHATLLAVAYIDAWRSRPIAAGLSGGDLEAAIESAARQTGLDTGQPFPFLIEGKASFAAHIIAGFCPQGVSPPDAGVEPWHWSGDQGQQVTVVGFFARDQQGVMTHHGSSMHAHVLTSSDDQPLTGHLDRLTTGEGMTIKLPATVAETEGP